MVTKGERITVFSACRSAMSYEDVRADFAGRFRKPGRTRLAINTLVNKVQLTGSVADGERPGRSP